MAPICFDDVYNAAKLSAITLANSRIADSVTSDIHTALW